MLTEKLTPASITAATFHFTKQAGCFSASVDADSVFGLVKFNRR